MHPIGGADVASAMIAAAQSDRIERIRIYRYDDMQALLA